jgi:hypothetical protein
MHAEEAVMHAARLLLGVLWMPSMQYCSVQICCTRLCWCPKREGVLEAGHNDG